jgi:type IV secretion system protein VirB5
MTAMRRLDRDDPAVEADMSWECAVIVRCSGKSVESTSEVIIMKFQAADQSDRLGFKCFSWVGTVAAGCLVVGSAHADWRVVDNKGNQTLSTIEKRLGDGDVNKNLEDLYIQQKIGGYQSAGNIAKDPDELLDKDLPLGKILTDIGLKERCPATATSLMPGAAQTQWQICRLLVQTELAQYKYSLRMYETAKERHKQLEKIQKERQALSPEDQGKLQDNSNKLLALIALMEIDRQQQKTYMDAYDARTRYLVAARDTVSKTVLNGDPLKKLASGGIGYATLKIALKEAETSKKDWKSERR